MLVNVSRSAVLALGLLLPAAGLAVPASFGANTDYTPVTCAGGGAFDPTQDANAAKDERDIVGDAANPAMYVRDDGTHVFFRLRLDANPLVGGGAAPLAQFGWGIGLDSDGVNTSIEYTIVVNGIGEKVSLVRSSDGKAIKEWSPTLTAASPNPIAGFVHVTKAGSALFGEDDYFLTVAVPMQEALDATKSDPKPLKWGKNLVWAGTSTNGVSIDKDFTCWDDGQPLDLAKAAVDPIIVGTYVEIGAPAAGAKVETVTPTLSGTTEPNLKVTITIGSQTATVTADASGKWSFEVPLLFGLPTVGNVTAKADVKDAQGNAASASVTFAVKVPTCTDKEMNGNETDVDCGGSCTTKCAADKGCATGKDCDSGICNGTTKKCLAGCASTTDCDADGLPNDKEDLNNNGAVDTGETDPNNPDSDGDGLLDGTEDTNKNGKFDAGETKPLVKDTDGDGLTDGLEDKNKNGKVDTGETDPTKADSDGDKLDDGVEDANKDGKQGAGETDPTQKDTDKDGLEDGVEDTNKDGKVSSGETDPLAADTDKDGIADGTEDANKNGSVDAGETDPLVVDTDKDGLDDATEDANKNGKLDAGETDATKADSDGDGVADGLEDKNHNGKVDAGETDPLVKDTDKDGIDDGVEDADKNGKLDAGETDPTKKDSDVDGLDDGVEDANKDGKVDAGETDPRKADSDGDTLNDGVEDANKNGKLDAGETDPTQKDTDKDGKTDDADNCPLAANATQTDTDGDKQGDACDSDDDGDGVDDGKDLCPLVKDATQGDADKDGMGDLCDDDDDNDGKKDGEDNCPLLANADQKDTDGDKQGDACDGDDDGDGVDDGKDTCPLDKVATQLDTDKDGKGDGCDDDDDNDGKKDGEDNCPLLANADQKDTDGDKQGDLCDNDDDGDGLPDATEDKNGNGKLDPGETDALVKDTDGDGLDDSQEDFNANGKVDADETDPTLPDTDGDGIKDGVEDKDKDGEVDPGETDPTKKDSDGDGLADGAEDKNGNGKVDAGETDPTKPDTDGDGLKDGDETTTDPTNKDTDGDGLSDAQEDKNGNGKTDPGETDATKPDSDGDGIKDGGEDKNGNGKTDPGETDPTNKDTDNDGLADGAEDKNGNGIVDNGETDPAQPGVGPVQLSGGGCTAGSKPSGGGWLAALLVTMLLMVRLRRGATVAVLALASTTAVAAPALAADGDYSLQRFRAAPTSTGLLHTDGARLLPAWNPNVGLWLHYDHRPLTVTRVGTGERVYDEVGRQVAMQLTAAMGVFGFGEIGVAIPLVLNQAGDARPAGMGTAPSLSAGIGDVRLHAKLRALSSGSLSLALSGAMDLPTASAAYSGDKGIGIEPRINVGYDTKTMGVAGTLGARLRSDFNPALSGLKNTPKIGSEGQLTLGGWYNLSADFLDALIDSRWSVNLQEQDIEERSGEILAGVRVHLPGELKGTAAAGPGLGQGLGTPAMRVVLGLVWAPDPGRDSDGDGIVDKVDRCPKEPEDKDDYEDKDGCVDPDNDKDGILDTGDKCRDEPEDADKFEDEDGCPDPDNDKDGLLDVADKCPLQPEDKDGFEDADGCVDPDNDKDGILDTADKCPNEHGVKEEAGCPVRDKDKDGLADNVDKCPDQPETFNGIDDEDGCPDKASKVEVTEKEIKILDKIYFETAKATIKPVSFSILDAVAAVLKAVPRVGKVRVEGHTDDVGNDDANLKLSQERAESVVKYLVDKGIAPERLVAKGFGETKALCVETADLLTKGKKAKKQLDACREQNRRVQFKLLEMNGKPVPEDDNPQKIETTPAPAAK